MFAVFTRIYKKEIKIKVVKTSDNGILLIPPKQIHTSD